MPDAPPRYELLMRKAGLEPDLAGAPGAWGALSALSAKLAADARALVRTSQPVGLEGASVCAVSLDQLSALLDGHPLPGVPRELARAVRRRQLSFLAGRLCAESALAQLGMPGSVIGRGFVGEPIWPNGWTGSISHSPDDAIAVVSRRHGRFDMGVDIERLVDQGMVHQVANTCLLPQEISRYLHDQAEARMHATALFSIKEAYFKSIHRVVQRHVDFHEVLVRQLSLSSGEFVVGPSQQALSTHAMPAMTGRIQVCGHAVISWVLPGGRIGDLDQLGSATYTPRERGVN